MSTAVETATRYTPEDLLAMSDGKGLELVDGHLVERKIGIEPSWVAGELHALLRQHGKEHDFGWAFQSECGYQCFPHEPGRVRKPDVSFVRYGRFPGGVLPKGWAKIPPDLAVEVVSPNDVIDELDEKLADYRKVGVPLIWVIYLRSRTVMVYRSDGSVSLLDEADDISGEDVIPGFHCLVKDILPRPEPVPKAPSNPIGTIGAG
jgi:Uma2 family endonuclease